MLFELFLASQAISPALLDQADSRNAAFVSCLFSVSRDSGATGLSADDFERKLDRACKSEEEELRTVSVRILRLRGHSEAEATDRTAKLFDEARRSVVTAYRQPF